MQNFFRRLAFQPVPECILFNYHFLIESRIQILCVHVIAPPHVILFSCLYSVAEVDVSIHLIPMAVRF